MNRAGGAHVRIACAVNFCIQLARFGLDHSNQLAGLPHQRGDHPPCLDRLGRASAVLQRVPVAFRSPAACPVHPADILSPNGGRLALEPAPLRSGVASLDARCIGQCMGLFSIFSAHPPLGWGDVADDRLPTLGDVDMLNRHLLLAAASVSLERLDLSGERPGELVECILGTVLLRNGLDNRFHRSEGYAVGTGLTSPAAGPDVIAHGDSVTSVVAGAATHEGQRRQNHSAGADRD